MKIKRFFAPDIRQAMRLVREEQGPDAVILSNRRVDGGVEIVAAIDYDERLLSAPAAAAAAAAAIAAEPARSPGPGSITESMPASIQASIQASPREATRVLASHAAPQHGATARAMQDPALTEMKSELAMLRRMLEGQLSSLAWGSFARGEPRRVELIERLMRFGMTAAQCRALSEAVSGDEADVDTLWQRALEVITRGLPVRERDLLTDGGVVALVGPTGAGKTTTAAKLAARCALRHGKRHVALISMDSYRVGAYEQLRTYGRILDVPVYTADSREELHGVLADLAGRHLVLIDTSGMSQFDSGLARQVEILDKRDFDKQVLLLLPATSRRSGLDDVAAAFAAFEPDAGVVTKIDETNCLGGALSAAVTHQLPLAYLCDGQRVPEDLHPAVAGELVARAVHIMNRSGSRIDEDLLTLSFGKEIANAHF